MPPLGRLRTVDSRYLDATPRHGLAPDATNRASSPAFAEQRGLRTLQLKVLCSMSCTMARSDAKKGIKKAAGKGDWRSMAGKTIAIGTPIDHSGRAEGAVACVCAKDPVPQIYADSRSRRQEKNLGLVSASGRCPRRRCPQPVPPSLTEYGGP